MPAAASLGRTQPQPHADAPVTEVHFIHVTINDDNNGVDAKSLDRIMNQIFFV